MGDISSYRITDGQGEYEPLPPGRYVVVIVDSVFRENRAATGRSLVLTFQVTEGPKKGNTIRAWLNLEHENEWAVKAAKLELDKIIKAVGVADPQDSAELHDIPLCISVTKEPTKDGRTFSKISGYFRLEKQTKPKQMPW